MSQNKLNENQKQKLKKNKKEERKEEKERRRKHKQTLDKQSETWCNLLLGFISYLLDDLRQSI